jgi:hypothetical protein
MFLSSNSSSPFLLERTLVVCISQGILPFHLRYQIYWHKVIHSVPCVPVNVYGICSETPLSFLIDTLCLLSYLPYGLSGGLSMLFTFSNNQYYGLDMKYLPKGSGVTGFVDS